MHSGLAIGCRPVGRVCRVLLSRTWRGDVLWCCWGKASHWLKSSGCSCILWGAARGSAQGHVFKSFGKHTNTVFMEVDMVIEMAEVQCRLMC